MWCRPTHTPEKPIGAMTREERRQALLVDPITRLPNRRAWREMEKGPARAWIDADGPEHLADAQRHALCERHLRAIAAALHDAMPGDVAYFYGDFFVAHAPTGLSLESGISKALRMLATLQTQMTRRDGAMLKLYGLAFSHWQASELPARAQSTDDIRGYAHTQSIIPRGSRLPTRLSPLFKAGFTLTQVLLTMPDGTIKEC